MTAWSAERLISAGTNQVVMLGTALRRMDRESFYADIHITTILPPNIDIDVMVVDRMAKQIVDVVGEYEEKLRKMDEQLWSEDLEAYLSTEEAEATRQTVEKWRSKGVKND
jgi:protein associated with RNAse G/E